MREVTGAVIATALVLGAVFVPVAFFPGTTGRLYQQFALTIAFSMALSAFNALTLTPALSALLLRGERKKNWAFRQFNRAFDAGTNVLPGGAAPDDPLALGRDGRLPARAGATGGCTRTVPSGFVPEEDQGYFMIIVQAPGRARRSSTRPASSGRSRRSWRSVPEIERAFSVGGFSFAGAGPNRGMIFVALKPYDERPGDAHSRAGRSSASSTAG